MIEIQAVTQRFSNNSGTIEAVRNVNLSIRKGEIFGIIGRSGAGKSTLVRTINLLNRPSSGTIVLDGQDLTTLSADQLRQARRQIGMIFQHFNLLSSRTVYGNIALPLELAGLSKDAIAAKVMPLLELVGLTELRDRYPAQISGGQKQRVGIARALANEPKVLLSDEATSALDPETTRSILELLRKINRELGLTIVLITHQMEVIKVICDRVAVMDAGEVIEEGQVLDVFREPKHEVTRALIGDVIAHELPQGVLERLRTRLAHNKDTDASENHLFRLAFTGSGVDQPLLSEAVRRYNFDFNILHGQIDEIQGQAFGSLAILASGPAAHIAAAVAYLREQGVVVEELNHVV
ncbi:methionine ABC transporter ATP-binding protein [Herbaspirillum sp. RTI4]|uniref:methionine ABC transporter ATP-binding protein n=1 Tax=Herbaspirillum sp. RTI4 TaxID=3048640 RepID=UPI002AB5B635|nr:methionine ABC transporter ATP-binding protein [Herbaspirillum sp. RTI4]MDY7579883.1 methionine ABC transporter ATP-binding protein [Herbaspirillum sp. RTI4]MEA9983484.1 methionine ABC transporter ATP-binding protein [Herbaspirillum sp. RTI4]